MKKNKITQINCHAEFSSASHGILKQVQDDRNNESGRSMVEMLGVLAIIGVLSVGGIAGYTTAMRSHRANEIVNACSLLYVVANTKNESDDVTYESAFGSLPTGVSELKYNNGTITAKITDAAVCTEVKNKLGDKVSGDCATSSTSTLSVTLGNSTTKKSLTDYTKCLESGGDVVSCCMSLGIDESPCQDAYGNMDTIHCFLSGKTPEYCICKENNSDTFCQCMSEGKGWNCCDCIENEGYDFCVDEGACN